MDAAIEPFAAGVLPGLALAGTVAPATTTALPPGMARRAGPRVQVIAVDALAVDALAEMLRVAGAVVVARGASVRACIELAAVNSPDVVFVDRDAPESAASK